VYSAYGLVIKAGCDGAGGGVHAIASGTSAEKNDDLDIHGDAKGAFFATEDESFGASSSDSLDQGEFLGSGVLDYATPDGHVVTLTYGFDTRDLGVFFGCSFTGVAVASP
jgi:hypothetical protein